MGTLVGVDDDRFDEIIELLRHDGGRITTTRKAVVRALLTQPEHHMTAADITTAVRSQDPDFQESTVYRTLERLIDLRVITQARIGPGPLIYHLSDDEHRHDHLLCNKCGSVTEVPSKVLGSAVRAVDRDYGFAVDAGGFTLTGLCATCRQG
jgi:Fe2+ or Zn2+ uptake regulation protein